LLYSIYEAVSNSVHAIEQRFGTDLAPTKGSIKAILSLDAEKSVRSITISDNGVGLNERHLESFQTCDTMEKSGIGGRGVGRLVWFQAFEDVFVRSAYETPTGPIKTVSFKFDAFSDNSLADIKYNDKATVHPGTSIELSGVKGDNRSKLSVTLLSRNLCHHFFPYFIGGSMPNLTIAVGKHAVSLNQYLQTKLVVEQSEETDLSDRGLGIITVTHVYVDTKIARKLSNSILLTAQGRVVESIEIEKKFALKDLDNKSAYACVVRGSFLDEKVNQERTSFKALEDDLQIIEDAALISAEKFLAPHIIQVRQQQKKIVVNLLEEHPQFAISVPNVTNYVDRLSPSMSDEDIGKNLFTLLYRHEKRVKVEIQQLAERPGDVTTETRKAIETLAQKVSEDAKRRLAEYTIKRHQIIQIARSMLRYTDENQKAYEWENAVHELICPMRRMLAAKDYDDHNLWLVDDLLSYYQFFASDKTLASMGLHGHRDEPDLIFFNPFGFRREGTNDPIVIVEFKRPGDEYLSSDPIDQVLGYIEKLQQKTVSDPAGEIISDIGENTPFECIVVCDLTKGARKKFERSVAQYPTPDDQGYFGYSPRHKATIKVLSYRKMFRDAEMRNKSFFDQLGLLPEEVNKAIAFTMKAA
jgi:hypothetical protein